ncbi:MAG: hypothetical protein RL514_2664 [Verrucomicrobiota bacterium]|jgi:hypothetical protein
MKTTSTEINRVLWDFATTWPDHADPFAGQPPTSPEADRALYLAAGAHLGAPPLPPSMTADAARQVADKALGHARQEAGVAMASRLCFNQHRLDPAKVRELCDLPLTELAQRFCDGECALPSSDEAVQGWVRGNTAQLRYWEEHYARLSQQPGGLAKASLCTLRQLACGYGQLAADILEPYWADPADTTFVVFHDQVIAAMPGYYHYTGPGPELVGEQDLPVAA